MRGSKVKRIKKALSDKAIPGRPIKAGRKWFGQPGINTTVVVRDKDYYA